MCDCCCDILAHCDILMLILRCCVENIHKNFLIRCYIGLAFDLIEYVILLCTERQVDNEQFKELFTVYTVFMLFISMYRYFKQTVYMFIFMMTFKCMSISVAIMIFRTSSDFEWQTITNQLSSGDFSDILLAIVIIVSFVDVWLNLGAMILQCFKIMCVVLQGNDTFHKLLVRSFDRFGRESEIEEDKALEILHRRINDIYYIRY